MQKCKHKKKKMEKKQKFPEQSYVRKETPKHRTLWNT